MFWFGYCPSGFHISFRLGFGVGPQERDQTSLLSGRLVDSCSIIGSLPVAALKSLAFLETLGVVVNTKKSELIPIQQMQYLGMIIDTERAAVSPSKDQVKSLKKKVKEFNNERNQSAKSWQSILGILASLEKIVPGGRLRMRHMQWQLKNAWSMNQSESMLVQSSCKVLEDPR